MLGLKLNHVSKRGHKIAVPVIITKGNKLDSSFIIHAWDDKHLK